MKYALKYLTQVDCIHYQLNKILFNRNVLQEKLTSAKNKQYQLQTELNIKNFEIEKANEKVEETLGELNKAQRDHAEDKEVSLISFLFTSQINK